MKRLVYQVCLGESGNSRLYKHCIESVAQYCAKYDIEHIVQRYPKLKIKPDPFFSNRSVDSWRKHGGYLPIFEKENAFDLLDDYDQIAIIDSDIYIRPNAKNLFEELECGCEIGVVFEREMNINENYKRKITNYSQMQYGQLHARGVDFKPNNLGFEFANMGMILLNKSFKKHLRGETAKQFINRLEFKEFVDGMDNWKWSTDQTLLNYFIKKYNVKVKHLSDNWNGLYGANTQIKECDFVHFFLKDLLPEKGENIQELMESI